MMRALILAVAMLGAAGFAETTTGPAVTQPGSSLAGEWSGQINFGVAAGEKKTLRAGKIKIVIGADGKPTAELAMIMEVEGGKGEVLSSKSKEGKVEGQAVSVAFDTPEGEATFSGSVEYGKQINGNIVVKGKGWGAAVAVVVKRK